jgi:hypothetical protein
MGPSVDLRAQVVYSQTAIVGPSTLLHRRPTGARRPSEQVGEGIELGKATVRGMEVKELPQDMNSFMKFERAIETDCSIQTNLAFPPDDPTILVLQACVLPPCPFSLLCIGLRLSSRL